jgi:hypothetical protein
MSISARIYFKLLLLTGCILLNYAFVFGQESFSGALNIGSILVHSESIKDVVDEPVKGFTVNYAFPNRFGADWRKNYNYPNYGLSYNYKSYGNPEVLGQSHSITSFLQLSFLKKHSIFDFGFKGFAGAGYFTKKYDSITNPTNNAISANLNISAEARLYSKIRLEPFFCEYSFGLNHFSNGQTKAPNLGINVLNNTFTIGVELEDQSTIDTYSKPSRIYFVKNEIWVMTSLGIKEIENQEKKYTFSSASINYSKQITAINKIGVGIDFLNDPSLTSVGYLRYHYLGSPDLNFRYGLNFHNEFIMGNTGIFAAYGFYLRESEFYATRGYYKAGFKFYRKNLIGVLLIRAIPLFRADVVEFGLGYRIKGNRKHEIKQTT